MKKLRSEEREANIIKDTQLVNAQDVNMDFTTRSWPDGWVCMSSQEFPRNEEHASWVESLEDSARLEGSVARLLGKSHQSRCADRLQQSDPALQVPQEWG